MSQPEHRILRNGGKHQNSWALCTGQLTDPLKLFPQGMASCRCLHQHRAMLDDMPCFKMAAKIYPTPDQSSFQKPLCESWRAAPSHRKLSLSSEPHQQGFFFSSTVWKFPKWEKSLSLTREHCCLLQWKLNCTIYRKQSRTGNTF